MTCHAHVVYIWHLGVSVQTFPQGLNILSIYGANQQQQQQQQQQTRNKQGTKQGTKNKEKTRNA